MVRAGIYGIGKYLPKKVLTNADLEKMVETNDEWIVQRTGIKERRISGKNELASDMGVEAVKQMVKDYSICLEDIDLILTHTVTPDLAFPSTANLISKKLGIKKNVGCIDLNSACAGFVSATTIANALITSKTYNNILVVGTDKMSKIVDYKDRTTCIIFGDAAGCVYLKRTEDNTGILDTNYFSNSDGVDFLHQKSDGYVWQDGRSVFKNAVTEMEKSIRLILEKQHFSVEDIDWVIPHQANLRIINQLGSNLGISEGKVLVNIEKYGNTTDATIPLCLYDFRDNFKKGDNMILTAFGGGFSWGSIYLKWSL